MLPAPRRLTDSRAFATTVRRGRRASTPRLVLHVAAPVRRDDDGAASSPSLGRTGRVGFVVSKAVGDAVTRNRVRRQLRHLVREQLDLVADGSTVVVRALPAAAGSTSAELGEDLAAALARVAS